MKRIAIVCSLLAGFAVSRAQLPSNVARYESSGFETYWIGDNADDRKNGLSLFPGVTEEVAGELGIADGIPSSMSVFLIREGEHILLFDTGMGAPGSLLLPSLSAIGVEADKVEAVFITHFHGDHTGGLAKDGKAVFPNAVVYVSRQEYGSMDGENILEPYRGKVVEFGFGEELIYRITAIDAAGHTPGHACFLKGDVLIAGDIMHGVALQTVHPEFCARYDKDPEASVAARIRIMAMAKEKKMLLCGMHFPKGGVIDFRK